MTVDEPLPRDEDGPVALVRHVFDALERADIAPLIEAMHADFRWTVMGTSAWSATYDGKAAVIGDLLTAVARQFSDGYTVTPSRIMSTRGEQVVVECQGGVTTTSGQRYDNTYCWIITVRNGSLRELVEYGDTKLIDSVLEPPGSAPPGS